MQKYLTADSSAPYARLKLAAYYAQRMCTSRRIRRLARRVVIAGLHLVHGKPQLRPPRLASSATLRAQGCLVLGTLLSDGQCADMLDYLRDKEMVAVRGDKRRFTMDDVPADACLGDYPPDTVVHCPHAMELANHPEVLALAADYLGYTPTITLVSLRWSFAGTRSDADVQHFHRDAEPASIKLLVYLTDVDADTGPHHYVLVSHRERMPVRLQRYAERDVLRRRGGSASVTGPAGTALFIDTKGIHKGVPPVRGARLLLTVQYSLLPCLMYEYAPLRYRGRGRFDPYVNRLMIAGDGGHAGHGAPLVAPDEEASPSPDLR